MANIRIGKHTIGEGNPCVIVAEIGINHNGDVEIAKKLIDAASLAGADFVKFQKRTVDVVYTAEELAKPRESPFGNTNGDLKRGLEFDRSAYQKIDAYCREKKIGWFASCWDEGAVDFISQFDVPCYKIASASLTDDDLLRYHARKDKPLILSTGMSTLTQVDHAYKLLGGKNLILMHCVSTYPADPRHLNLRSISRLMMYNCPVGWSGHEVGLATTVAAVALGAKVIERHITLDRAMWGSDQAASVEPYGFHRLVRDIRAVESAMGTGDHPVLPEEIPIMKKLRRKDTARLGG